MEEKLYTIEEVHKSFTIHANAFQVRDSETYYQTHIKCLKFNWIIDKTYKQYLQLYRQINEITFGVDALQPKKFLKKVSSEEYLIKINQFLENIKKRKDILASKIFRDFIHLDNYVKIDHYKPIQLQCIESEKKMAIIDFIYDEKDQALFCLQVQNNPMKKVAIFFNTLFQNNQSEIHLGRLSLSIRNELKWKIDFKAKPLCFHWNHKSNMLMVSLDNTDIMVYLVKVSNSYQSYQQFTVIHTKILPRTITMSAYTGLGYGLTQKSFFSFSIKESKVLKFYDSIVKNTAIAIDQLNDRIFVANEYGSITVYNLKQKGLPENFCNFGPKQAYTITTLEVSNDKQFLLAGTNQEYILVFQLFKKGKQNLSQHISTISCPPALKTICFCKDLKLIFTNYNKNIIILNTNNTTELSLQLHSAKITKIQFIMSISCIISSDEQGKLLFTEYSKHQQQLQAEPKRPSYYNRPVSQSMNNQM